MFRSFRSLILATIGLAAALCGSGCSSLAFNIPAIPANRVPKDFLGRPRKEMQQISISRLRQRTPETYQLAAGDILGIYIESVIGKADEAPPVHFPEQGDQPPSIGYPVPVREDGTLALPLADPITVEGMTVEEATDEVRRAYTVDKEILKPGKDKIIVTLMRRRMFRVLVIREESGGKENVTKRGTGTIVDLPAYENDVLHALNMTGGLPGLDAKNEILIIRGGCENGAEYDQFVSQIKSCKQPCECPPDAPDPPNMLRIPIRFFPGSVPQFTEDDIILDTGDIIYIPSRDNDRYYTGGVMRGGEFSLPRDYDLDVLGAVAVAGGSIGSGGTGIGGGGNGGGGGGATGGGQGRTTGCTPSDLIILRKVGCGGQVPIRVNLKQALVDPSQRILVQPEDTLILRYTLPEELYNAALNLISFNFLLNGLTAKKF